MAGETPAHAPSARRKVVGSKVRALFPQGVSRVWRSGVREVPDRSVTPNRPIPSRARYLLSRLPSRTSFKKIGAIKIAGIPIGTNHSTPMDAADETRARGLKA